MTLSRQASRLQAQSIDGAVSAAYRVDARRDDHLLPIRQRKPPRRRDRCFTQTLIARQPPPLRTGGWLGDREHVQAPAALSATILLALFGRMRLRCEQYRGGLRVSCRGVGGLRRERSRSRRAGSGAACRSTAPPSRHLRQRKAVSHRVSIRVRSCEANIRQ